MTNTTHTPEIDLGRELPPPKFRSVMAIADEFGSAATAYTADEVHDILARQAVPGAPTLPNGWKLEQGGDDVRLVRADGKWCGYSPDIDSPAHRMTLEFLRDLIDAPATQQAGAPSEQQSDEEAYAQSGYRHFMSLEKFRDFRAGVIPATPAASSQFAKGEHTAATTASASR